jgi:acetyl-CoA carboxylase, biotin carboxylase subunit
VEMLLDADGRMYFMEMNTRLQVEHPISEETTGIDLVEWQLLVAAGHPLPRTQDQIASSGHAIELRINAEDPDQGFRPSPGRITRLQWPEGEGIRVDSHLRTGDSIPPYYDSMIGKLIARGADRAEAIERLRGALTRVVVEGVTTNLGLHERILRWDAFLSGSYDTRSLETYVLAGRS